MASDDILSICTESRLATNHPPTVQRSAVVEVVIPLLQFEGRLLRLRQVSIHSANGEAKNNQENNFFHSNCSSVMSLFSTQGEQVSPPCDVCSSLKQALQPD